MNTITQTTYKKNNVNFKGYTPADICSKLCKGACCDHSTVLSMPLKRATDRLMGEYFKSNNETRATLPIKKIIYTWALNTRDKKALELNEQINKLISKLQETTSKENITVISKNIDELNNKLATLIDTKAEIFLPITNPKFKNNPTEAVTSNLPNICMYKDPVTNKCTIYHGLITPEKEIIQRPSPCHRVGSKDYPCPWHNPEKLEDTLYSTNAALASQGYKVSKETIFRYVADQYNLNETWHELIYKPYLKSNNLI